jgi:hypothetical protein
MVGSDVRFALGDSMVLLAAGTGARALATTRLQGLCEAVAAAESVCPTREIRLFAGLWGIALDDALAPTTQDRRAFARVVAVTGDVAAVPHRAHH